jgi:hypothetical protein
MLGTLVGANNKQERDLHVFSYMCEYTAIQMSVRQWGWGWRTRWVVTRQGRRERGIGRGIHGSMELVQNRVRHHTGTEVAPTPRSPMLFPNWLAFLATHPLLLVCGYNFTRLYFQCLAIEQRKNYSNWIEHAFLTTPTIWHICVTNNTFASLI